MLLIHRDHEVRLYAPYTHDNLLLVGACTELIRLRIRQGR